MLWRHDRKLVHKITEISALKIFICSKKYLNDKTTTNPKLHESSLIILSSFANTPSIQLFKIVKLLSLPTILSSPSLFECHLYARAFAPCFLLPALRAIECTIEIADNLTFHFHLSVKRNFIWEEAEALKQWKTE